MFNRPYISSVKETLLKYVDIQVISSTGFDLNRAVDFFKMNL